MSMVVGMIEVELFGDNVEWKRVMGMGGMEG